MAEQFANHDQRNAVGYGDRCETVAQIVQANIGQCSVLPYRLLWNTESNRLVAPY